MSVNYPPPPPSYCAETPEFDHHSSGFSFFPGMFAIRAERDYVIEEDFMKAARKVSDNKKLESKLDYKPV